MNAQEVGFTGKTQISQIRVGKAEDVGVSISPRNDNMFLWLNENLYYQNDEGLLFVVDFQEVPIKKKRKNEH